MEQVIEGSSFNVSAADIHGASQLQYHLQAVADLPLLLSEITLFQILQSP